MSPPPRYSSMSVGDDLPALAIALDRADLARYASASGDDNPIHLDDTHAQGVGLPGVIAHGMLVMGMAARVVTQWLADPGAIVSYDAGFLRPVPVPLTGPVHLTVTGSIATKLPDGLVAIRIRASCNQANVLKRAVLVARVL